MRLTPENKVPSSNFSRNKNAEFSPFFNKTGRLAPKGNNKENDNPFFNINGHVQPKLKIGKSGDKYEREADAVADNVVRKTESNKVQKMGKDEEDIQNKPLASTISPLVQKQENLEEENVQTKCAACENEEKVQRMEEEEESVQAKGNQQGTKNQGLETSLNSSKGGGTPLKDNVRGEMEQGFGADFSGVKVHTDSRAIQLNRELGSQAFTNGNDIYFNQGKYQPNSKEGKHLLAHELTHTVQQGASGVNNSIQKKVIVYKPNDNIANPTGKGIVKKNKEIAQEYLNKLCPDGKILVDAKGEVKITVNGICTIIAVPSKPVGCGCLCDMVNSKKTWKIKIDDSTWPHTLPDDHKKGSTKGSGGTGGIVTAPSPNDEEAWGAVTKSGKFTDIPPWLILGHELCGHAWMMDQGEHAKDENPERGRGGHQATVERENLIRDEHGIERRGNHRAPYCGESFFHKKGTPNNIKSVKMSGSLEKCKQWRKEYNKLNKTNFKISDNIPVKKGEKLP